MSLRSSSFIFPVAVFGSSSTNSIQRGYLYGVMRPFTNCLAHAPRLGSLTASPAAGKEDSRGAFAAAAWSALPCDLEMIRRFLVDGLIFYTHRPHLLKVKGCDPDELEITARAV